VARGGVTSHWRASPDRFPVCLCGSWTRSPGADDDALGGLLAEAFHGGRGEQLLRQVADSQLPVPVPPVDSPWASVTDSLVRAAFSRRATARLVGELAAAAADLPRYVFRPLFRERQQLTVAAALSPDPPSNLGCGAGRSNEIPFWCRRIGLV